MQIISYFAVIHKLRRKIFRKNLDILEIFRNTRQEKENKKYEKNAENVKKIAHKKDC